jgi:hypothetical protein
MSETEWFKGKLEKIDCGSLGLEEFAKEFLGGKKNDKYYDTFLEHLIEESRGIYFLYKNNLYEVLGRANIEDDEDIFRADLQPDGTINFELKFYNGGCNFQEAIETALDTINL